MKNSWITYVLVAVALVVAIAAGAVGMRLLSGNPATVAATPAAPAAPTANPLDAAASPAVLPDTGPAVPKLVVIDRNMILRLSSAGKDMTNQAAGLSRSADAEFRAAANALQDEATKLQASLAILPADQRTQKQKEFDAKQDQLQARVADRQNQIQNGFAKAGAQLDQALGPILQQIMTERGANMVLDRGVVLLSSLDNIDVTATAIERLDKALPHVKVELVRGAPAAPAATAP